MQSFFFFFAQWGYISPAFSHDILITPFGPSGENEVLLQETEECHMFNYRYSTTSLTSFGITNAFHVPMCSYTGECISWEPENVPPMCLCLDSYSRHSFIKVHLKAKFTIQLWINCDPQMKGLINFFLPSNTKCNGTDSKPSKVNAA